MSIMKMIWKIAKKELQLLFFSPVAWFLLVVFTIQAGMVFVGNYHNYMKSNEFGSGVQFMVSFSLFVRALWGQVSAYLYFYIPLLTMGLVSKELSSGSIKLLYSSPVSNTQIILGKFFSMVGFAFVMCLMLSVYVIVAWCTVQDFEWAVVLTGLLGLFLLTCTYAAVGIFVSSLTSYQFVAAVGTFIVLMFLSLIGGWWQEYDFVRDVTYWLCINGRVNTFIMGMICSEDVLYFPLVTALFLALTIIRLNAVRQKIKFSVTMGKNIVVILIACLLGYFSSRPKLMAYYDTSSTKWNTLTEESLRIVEQLDGDLFITAYVNVLDPNYYSYAFPRFIQRNRRIFERYERFKPETKLKVIYYYDTITEADGGCRLFKENKGKSMWELAKKVCEDTGMDSTRLKTPEEIRKMLDLTGERTFVWQIVRENGQKTWLRTFDDPMDIFPHESEISAALKRVASSLPKIGFVTGYGMRSIYDSSLRGYDRYFTVKYARLGMINQGFDVEEVDLHQEIPADINVLTIADMREPFSEKELGALKNYVDRGGNLFILAEPRRREVMNLFLKDLFGVELTEGVLVQHRKPEQRPEELFCLMTGEAATLSYHYGSLSYALMPTTTGIEMVEPKGFVMTPILKTDTLANELKKRENRSYRVWNELESLNYEDEPLKYNPAAGEVAKEYYTAVALSRKLGEREQRVVIMGDSDCISNGDSQRCGGVTLLHGTYHYLSHNEMPVDTRRSMTTDTVVHINKTSFKVLRTGLMILYPLFFLGMGLFFWIRRRGR